MSGWARGKLQDILECIAAYRASQSCSPGLQCGLGEIRCHKDSRTGHRPGSHWLPRVCSWWTLSWTFCSWREASWGPLRGGLRRSRAHRLSQQSFRGSGCTDRISLKISPGASEMCQYFVKDVIPQHHNSPVSRYHGRWGLQAWKKIFWEHWEGMCWHNFEKRRDTRPRPASFAGTASQRSSSDWTSRPRILRSHRDCLSKFLSRWNIASPKRLN